MTSAFASLYTHRELIKTLAWKNIAIRYKQAYLGIAWAVIKPVTLMLIFTLMKSFIGIDSGSIPYPILTFAALVPWIFFQESASERSGAANLNTAISEEAAPMGEDSTFTSCSLPSLMWMNAGIAPRKSRSPAACAA